MEKDIKKMIKNTVKQVKRDKKIVVLTKYKTIWKDIMEEYELTHGLDEYYSFNIWNYNEDYSDDYDALLEDEVDNIVINLLLEDGFVNCEDDPSVYRIHRNKLKNIGKKRKKRK